MTRDYDQTCSECGGLITGTEAGVCNGCRAMDDERRPDPHAASVEMLGLLREWRALFWHGDTWIGHELADITDLRARTLAAIDAADAAGIKEGA